ncbi:unnamed protein product [Effrenium voratum]|nr:unnamed protein product [Effrenium voratum]
MPRFLLALGVMPLNANVIRYLGVFASRFCKFRLPQKQARPSRTLGLQQVAQVPSVPTPTFAMTRGLTSLALGLVSGISLLVSPVMIFRSEWVVRKTGALAPHEQLHPISKRFLVAFEMTAFSLAALGARACALGTASERVFWAKMLAVPCASLCTSISIFGYEKGHQFHGKNAGAKAFGAMTTLLFLGTVVYPEREA